MKKTMKTCLLSILWLLCTVCCPVVWADIPAGTDYSTLNSAPDREAAYRNREFRAYLPLESICQRLCTGNYSAFENPTGIFFTAGESVTVEIAGEVPEGVSFIIHNFDRDGGHEEFPLKSGKNEFTTPVQGLGYLNYRADAPQQAPALQVKISGGYVNGVFTQHDDAAVWAHMLAHARGNILDILGERVQLAYSVEALRKHCPKRGPELVAIYDEVLRMQQDMLGWERDNCHPGAHLHGRVQWRGFMHADATGTAYVYSAMNEVADVDALKNSVWAIAHEFGHLNQCRPAMMWAGSAEVTNNIFSAWCCYNINPEFCRLEHERTSVMGYHRSMRGGRMDCYINSALVRRQLWQFMTGPDGGISSVPANRTGDHFVSVCPMWQLQLFFAVARGNNELYPYVFHHARQQPKDTPHGQLRVLFCTRAADAVQLDLSEFFVRTGMLAPMNRYVEDYQGHWVTITPEMCREAIAHMRRYPKPDTSVIYYVTANSVHIFRDRLPVQASPDFVPNVDKGIITIPGDTWKNAVAFECYRGKRLVRVALRGLNHEDNATTDLIVPKGVTSIKAVQWDGTRYTIWQR